MFVRNRRYRNGFWGTCGFRKKHAPTEPHTAYSSTLFLHFSSATPALGRCREFSVVARSHVSPGVRPRRIRNSRASDELYFRLKTRKKKNNISPVIFFVGHWNIFFPSKKKKKVIGRSRNNSFPNRSRVFHQFLRVHVYVVFLCLRFHTTNPTNSTRNDRNTTTMMRTTRV